MPTEEELKAAEEKAAADKIASDKVAADKAAADAKALADNKKKTADEKFKVWYDKLSDEDKELYDSHTHGLKSALDKERENAKGQETYLKRLAELEAAETKRLEEAMTKEELLTKRIKEAEDAKKVIEGKYTATLLKTAITTIAAKPLFSEKKLSFIDPEDVYIMCKGKIEKLEISDDGTVEGATEILQELAKSKPYLLKGADVSNKQLGTPQGGRKLSAGGEKEEEKVRLPIPF